ncbi:MAG: glycosyltransferase [Ignavibacteria bacterium]|nr:glycosyltransferase [Ignavibacteria bacterium]
MKLAIISHTPHYRSEGIVKGWGSTVTEINHLAKLFDRIFHVAPLHEENSPGSSLPYIGDKIEFIPLKPYGGSKLSDKFSIIKTAPYNLSKINSVLKILGKKDWVQFRAPTAMGLYVLPFLKIRNKSKLWVKYAGNWKMENPPFSYRFQKWWLENNIQKSKVTINGYWKGQKDHLINFINPCIDETELAEAGESALKKNFNGKLTICFSGTLTENKGTGLILEALQNFSNAEKIEEVLFAGDGSGRKLFEEKAAGIKIKIKFLGFINREELKSVYSKSHLILLPSESEGFPKVIAEAAAYGCVPVVSDISSISQYFNNVNAYLLEKISSPEIEKKIHEADDDRNALRLKSGLCVKTAKKFTYEHFLKSLQEKILTEQ